MDNKELFKLRAATLEKVAIMTKTAAAPENFSSAMRIVGMIGAGVILAQFINRLVKLGEQKLIEMKEPGYYKVMIEKNPQLLEEDPQEVLETWSTFYRTAPHLAEDPIAAGAFVTQQMAQRSRRDIGGPTLDTYKTLTDINKNFGAQAFDQTSGMMGAFMG